MIFKINIKKHLGLLLSPWQRAVFWAVIGFLSGGAAAGNNFVAADYCHSDFVVWLVYVSVGQATAVL